MEKFNQENEVLYHEGKFSGKHFIRKDGKANFSVYYQAGENTKKMFCHKFTTIKACKYYIDNIYDTKN